MLNYSLCYPRKELLNELSNIYCVVKQPSTEVLTGHIFHIKVMFLQHIFSDCQFLPLIRSITTVTYSIIDTRRGQVMFSASAVESVKDKTVNLVEQTEKSSQKTMEVRMTTMDLHFHASLNPLTPMSDQDRISPYNIHTISTR